MAREQGRTMIAQNKKARHDYSIEDVFEAGIVLEGWEVKSLREGKVQLVFVVKRVIQEKPVRREKREPLEHRVRQVQLDPQVQLEKPVQLVQQDTREQLEQPVQLEDKALTVQLVKPEKQVKLETQVPLV